MLPSCFLLILPASVVYVCSRTHVCIGVPLPEKGSVDSSEPSDGSACLHVPFGHQVVGSTQLDPVNLDGLYLSADLETNSFHFSIEHPDP